MIFKLALLLSLVGQVSVPPTAEPEDPTAPPAAAKVQSAEKTTPPEGQVVGETQQGTTKSDQSTVPAPVAPQQSRTRQLVTWGILLGIIVVFYLLMIIPQRRRQKKHMEMLKALNRGDKIITNGGVIGTIAKVKEDTFVIKTAGKTEIEISKSVVTEKK